MTGEDFGDFCKEEGYEIVLFDSNRELFDQTGGEGNQEKDWSKIWSLLGSPLLQRGITPVFLDNTGHKNQHRAAGTVAKSNTLQQGYRFKTLSHFGPDRTGKVEIKCTRSRLGHKGQVSHMTLGGGVWEAPTQNLDDGALSDHEKTIAALTQKFERMTDVAERLDVSYQTLKRWVEDINTAPEYDSDDEDREDFEPPIMVRGGGKTGKPTEIRLVPDGGLDFEGDGDD